MGFYLRIYKLAILISFFCVNLSFADTPKTYIISVENISYTPYFFTDRFGTYSGFSRELFDLFAKKNKISIKFQPMPVARLLKDFFNGRLELKFPDNKEWQKENRINKNIYYSDNVVEFIDGIIIKNENKDKDFSSLKSIGTIRGFETSIYKMKGIRIDESSNVPELIDRLDHNKVDAVYFNVSVAIHYINSNEKYKNKFMFKREFPYSKEFYKLSSMKNKDFIDKFNQFLKKSSKDIDRLKKKNGIIF